MVTMSSFNLNTAFYTTVKATAKVTIVVLFILLSACAAPKIGSVPEQVEPDVPTGPGILTGDTGEFSVSDFFDPEKKNKNRSRDITVTGSDVDIPAIDLDSFEEFERFKAWRRAQEVGSIEYQEWLDYQDFLRLKAEK
jgi:hypothetical protein